MSIDLPNIPIPLGGLFKWIQEKIEKQLFEDIYQSSHYIHLQNTALGNTWWKLNDYLEISYHIENQFSNDINPSSSIEVRNISDREIDEVFLTILAESYYGKIYQEHISIIQLLPQKEYVFYLKNIPLDRILEITKDDGLIFSYKHISTQINFLTFEGVKQKINEKMRPHIFIRNYIFSHWKNKWGLWWNLDFIERANSRYEEKIYYSLNYDNFIVQNTFTFFERIKILDGIFWLLLMSKNYQIDRYGELHRKKPQQ